MITKIQNFIEKYKPQFYSDYNTIGAIVVAGKHGGKYVSCDNRGYFIHQAQGAYPFDRSKCDVLLNDDTIEQYYYNGTYARIVLYDGQKFVLAWVPANFFDNIAKRKREWR